MINMQNCPLQDNQEAPFTDLNSNHHVENCTWQQLIKYSFISEYKKIAKRLPGWRGQVVGNGLEVLCNGTTSHSLSFISRMTQYLQLLKEKNVHKFIFLGDSVMVSAAGELLHVGTSQNMYICTQQLVLLTIMIMQTHHIASIV